MNYKNWVPVEDLYSSFGEFSLDWIVFIKIWIKAGNIWASVSKGGGHFTNGALLTVKPESEYRDFKCGI